MEDIQTYLFGLTGAIFSVCGWWCLFRTDDMAEVFRNDLVSTRVNWIATFVTGVFLSFFGLLMFISSVARLLGLVWTSFAR
jgi:hypothetical protein